MSKPQDLLSLFNAFAKEHIGDLSNFDQWPELSLPTSASNETGDLERKRIGFRLTLRLLLAAFESVLVDSKTEPVLTTKSDSELLKKKVPKKSPKLLSSSAEEQKREPFIVNRNSANFVQDTCFLVPNGGGQSDHDKGQDDVDDGEDDPNDLSFIPETQVPETPSPEAVKNTSTKLSKKRKASDIPTDERFEDFKDDDDKKKFKTPPRSKHPKHEQNTPSTSKDEAVREKYPSLSVVHTTTKGEGQGPTSGVLGHGESKIVFDSSVSAAEEESPSVFGKGPQLNIGRERDRDKNRKSKKEVIDIQDDDDESDFKPEFHSTEKMAPSSKRATRSKLSRSRNNKVKSPKNRYGMQVDPPPSHSQNMKMMSMKQGSIKELLKNTRAAKKVLVQPDDEEDEEFRRAIEMSKLEAKKAAANKSKTETTSSGDDSFDCYSPVKENIKANNQRKFIKCVGSPVRKKEDREKLIGFSCKECDKFYAGDNLTDEQRQNVLQKCSRHRGEFKPPPSSPQNIWKVDLEPDRTIDQTQPGSPISRRKIRRFREEDEVDYVEK